MQVLDSELYIFRFEHISPRIVHELDGSLDDLSSLQLNDCLQSGVVRLGDDSLRFLWPDDMINQIWVVK